MNKTELIAQVARDTGQTQVAVQSTLNAILGAITETLANGGSVMVTGFGTFATKKRAARSGKSPTGEYHLPERTAPTFRAGQALKDAVR